MNKERFAQYLNGREYRDEMTEEDEYIAKSNDLVVIFGASDDLTEFRGAINDEVSSWEGGKFFFRDGGIANDDFTEVPQDLLKKWEADEVPMIQAVWCPKDSEGNTIASWGFRTKLPHTTFDIMEDGELYCKGIVVHVDSLYETV